MWPKQVLPASPPPPSQRDLTTSSAPWVCTNLPWPLTVYRPPHPRGEEPHLIAVIHMQQQPGLPCLLEPPVLMLLGPAGEQGQSGSGPEGETPAASP